MAVELSSSRTWRQQSWIGFLAASVLLASLTGSSASAISYGFGCITNNLAGDCAIGEVQLVLDVTDAGANQVLFTFSNLGPAASAITDVYFDDGTLLGISTLINTPGLVEFTVQAIPSNLPGGGSLIPPFISTVGFTADAVSPPPALGVDPLESLGVIFDLQPGGTFADVILELADQTLRVGIRAQDFSSGGSESFVNLLAVPEPGAAVTVALTFGLSMMVARRLRR